MDKPNETSEDLINWGRKNSLWFMTQPRGCCGIEMIATGCAEDMLGEWPLRKDYKVFPNATAKNLV